MDDALVLLWCSSCAQMGGNYSRTDRSTGVSRHKARAGWTLPLAGTLECSLDGPWCCLFEAVLSAREPRRPHVSAKSHRQPTSLLYASRCHQTSEVRLYPSLVLHTVTGGGALARCLMVPLSRSFFDAVVGGARAQGGAKLPRVVREGDATRPHLHR